MLGWLQRGKWLVALRERSRELDGNNEATEHAFVVTRPATTSAVEHRQRRDRHAETSS